MYLASLEIIYLCSHLCFAVFVCYLLCLCRCTVQHTVLELLLRNHYGPHHEPAITRSEPSVCSTIACKPFAVVRQTLRVLFHRIRVVQCVAACIIFFCVPTGLVRDLRTFCT